MSGGGAAGSYSEMVESIMGSWLDGDEETGVDYILPSEKILFPFTHYMNYAQQNKTDPDTAGNTWQEKIGEPYGNPFIDKTTDQLFSTVDVSELVNTAISEAELFLSEAAEYNDPENTFCAIAEVLHTCQALNSLNKEFSGLEELPSKWKEAVVYAPQKIEETDYPLVETVQEVKESLSTLDETTISFAVDQFAAVYDRGLEEVTLPRFKRSLIGQGMVRSSAFAVGQAVIEEGRDRDVAKFHSDLRIQIALQRAEQDKLLLDAATVQERERFAAKTNAWLKEDELINQSRLSYNNNMAELLRQRNDFWRDLYKHHTMTALELQKTALSYLELRRNALHYYVEAVRVGKILESEVLFQNLEIRHKAYIWDFEIFQRGANMLASVQGGITPVGGGISKTQSTIGGAFQGAAIGTEVSAGYGTAVGAVVGAIAGYFMGG